MPTIELEAGDIGVFSHFFVNQVRASPLAVFLRETPWNMGCDGLGGWLACGRTRDLRVRRAARLESTGFDRSAPDSFVRST
jgi:hypothetical protein